MLRENLQPKLTEQTALLEGMRRQPTNKIVLLYSAGADSTATGLKLREDGFSIHPIFIDYGQTASKAEEFLANQGSEQFDFQNLHIIRLADLMLSLSQSALLGGEARDDTQAWVPARNTIFMLLAGTYAYQIDADGIAVGCIADDQ